MPLRAWHGISTPPLSDTLPAAHAPHGTALARFLTFSTSILSGLGRLGSPGAARSLMLPACRQAVTCHYILSPSAGGVCAAALLRAHRRVPLWALVRTRAGWRLSWREGTRPG